MHQYLSRTTLMLLIVLLAAGAAQARSGKVDAIFSAYTAPGSPGVSVAVLQGNEVVFSKGYGLAQLEYEIPITPKTIFHVASISKQFTAFAVVLLSLDGKLSLDDDIRTHLPELADFGHTITIRHLIHHTSGLRDQWSLLQLAGWRMDDVITTADILELVVRQRELNFTPGTQSLYCNTGYTLLGEIVARVSGQPFPEFCRERIFTPLAMTNTHFHDDHEHIVPNRAYSYSPGSEGTHRNAVLSFANAGATSLFTTPEDLLRWQMNFEHFTAGGAEAINIMLQPGLLGDGSSIDYGFALVRGKYKGLNIISHGGSDAGFRSFLVRFPDQGLSVALAANLGSVDAEGLAFQVAERFLGDAIQEDNAAGNPKVVQAYNFVELPESALEGYSRHYFNESLQDAIRLRKSKTELRFMPRRERMRKLGAVSATEFRALDAPDSLLVNVNLDSTGIPESIVVTEGGGTPVTYGAAADVEAGTPYLEAFAGDYYSEELDVVYRIRFDGTRLELVRSKYGTTALTPNFADDFTNNAGNLHFSRDAAGHPDGFRINTGRIFSLRFDRVK